MPISGANMTDKRKGKIAYGENDKCNEILYFLRRKDFNFSLIGSVDDRLDKFEDCLWRER